MRYVYENGHYILKTPGKPDQAFKEVGLLYGGLEPGKILHAHGEADWVQRRYEDTFRCYQAAGLGREAADLKVFRSSTIPASELNRCITIEGYLKRMVDRLKREAEANAPTP